MDAEVISFCLASDVTMLIGFVAAVKAAMEIVRDNYNELQ